MISRWGWGKRVSLNCAIFDGASPLFSTGGVRRLRHPSVIPSVTSLRSLFQTLQPTASKPLNHLPAPQKRLKSSCPLLQFNRRLIPRMRGAQPCEKKCHKQSPVNPSLALFREIRFPFVLLSWMSPRPATCQTPLGFVSYTPHSRADGEVPGSFCTFRTAGRTARVPGSFCTFRTAGQTGESWPTASSASCSTWWSRTP